MLVEGERPTSTKGWEAMHAAVAPAVKELGVEGVRAALARGADVIDVRPRDEFDNRHLEGSVSCQLFRRIAGNSGSQRWRKAGFAFFGINGSELNPDFLDEVAALLGDSQKPGGGGIQLPWQKGKGGGASQEVVLVCWTGGTLEESRNFPLGVQSRSLTAAYQLVKQGYRNVSFVGGGLSGIAAADDSMLVDNRDLASRLGIRGGLGSS